MHMLPLPKKNIVNAGRPPGARNFLAPAWTERHMSSVKEGQLGRDW
jgi:hypothetical protein